MSHYDTLLELVRHAASLGASDIHLHGGQPVWLRVNGDLRPKGQTAVPPHAVESILQSLANEEQRGVLEKDGHVDFAVTLPEVGRCRVNAYRRLGGTDLVLRFIRTSPLGLEQLGLPRAVADATEYKDGLVLVCGPGGSGKTSTLAALIQRVSETRDDHVLILEAPIEYVHKSGRAIINQREVGRHTQSYARALRATLRQDPDVIVVGELVDRETTQLALTAAETGHLVLSTMHTTGVLPTIDRMINVFPPMEQSWARTHLAATLRVVMYQRLVKRADGRGRVPACEVLVVTPPAAQLIRDGETVQLRSLMQLGANRGMNTLEDALRSMAARGLISADEARLNADFATGW
jgi:twitching motility protein PilT